MIETKKMKIFEYNDPIVKEKRKIGFESFSYLLIKFKKDFGLGLNFKMVGSGKTKLISGYIKSGSFDLDYQIFISPKLIKGYNIQKELLDKSMTANNWKTYFLDNFKMIFSGQEGKFSKKKKAINIRQTSLSGEVLFSFDVVICFLDFDNKVHVAKLNNKNNEYYGDEEPLFENFHKQLRTIKSNGMIKEFKLFYLNMKENELKNFNIEGEKYKLDIDKKEIKEVPEETPSYIIAIKSAKEFTDKLIK